MPRSETEKKMKPLKKKKGHYLGKRYTSDQGRKFIIGVQKTKKADKMKNQAIFNFSKHTNCIRKEM